MHSNVHTHMYLFGLVPLCQWHINLHGLLNAEMASALSNPRRLKK